jgi:hypothetical protein
MEILMAVPTELWGTFAVDDHRRARPFVAEMLLFDRLVIPTPPAWTREALEKWPAKWQPLVLKPLLDVLGDRAIQKPWTAEREKRWQTEYAEFQKSQLAGRQQEAVGIAFDAENIRAVPRDTPAKVITRGSLKNELDAEDEHLVQIIRDLPIPPVTKIEAVTAYSSYAKFRKDVAASAVAGTQGDADPRDALLLTWDVFIPEDTNLSDVQMLQKIVKLNENPEFVEHRTAFQVFRRELLAKNVDLFAAKLEIEERLAAYNGILKSVSRVRKARTFLTYAAIGVQLMDFVRPGLGIATGVGLGLASSSWESWAPNPKAGPYEQSVAMVHDLRKAFQFV